MIKRRGEATIIALVLLALFIISLIATLFIVNSAINTYMETSKKVFRNVEEKRAEDLTIKYTIKFYYLPISRGG